MSKLPYTKEDAESDYQMSIDHPICPVCKDSGFYIDYQQDPPERKPCENCNV
jgi:hypothetical protein